MTQDEISPAGALHADESPQPSQRILHAIRRITRAADLYSKKLVAEFGITTAQLLVLEQIVAKGAMMVRSVAAKIHLSASTLVGIVDRLEAKGLARRQRTDVDRRKVMVVATETGRALVARTPSALQGTLAEALKHLSRDEQETIARSLERVVALMEIGRWEVQSERATDVPRDRGELGRGTAIRQDWEPHEDGSERTTFRDEPPPTSRGSAR